MKDVLILAIETSCDETSAAIIKNGADNLATVVLSQMNIHEFYGGVVPEIASRNHSENITLVIEECLTKANLELNDMDAIAVTYGPGLNGALLVGVEAAKTLAFVTNKPLIAVHHIAGHIYANQLVKPLEFPLICLVVSGGHTDLIYMKDHYQFEKLGGTLDDAVGETYDKVARLIDLPYPGGPRIDALAKEGKITYDFPIPLDDESYNFSFSGLKSSILNFINKVNQKGEAINKADLAVSFQDVIIKILTKKTLRAVKFKNVKNLIIAGGVSANSGLRKTFMELCNQENINLSIPPLNYCTDNAAMIGAAAYHLYLQGKFADFDLETKPHEPFIEGAK